MFETSTKIMLEENIMNISKNKQIDKSQYLTNEELALLALLRRN